MEVKNKNQRERFSYAFEEVNDRKINQGGYVKQASPT